MHGKIYSVSSALRKYKFNPPSEITADLKEWSKIATKSNATVYAEKLNNSHSDGGKVKQYSHFYNLAVFGR